MADKHLDTALVHAGHGGGALRARHPRRCARAVHRTRPRRGGGALRAAPVPRHVRHRRPEGGDGGLPREAEQQREDDEVLSRRQVFVDRGVLAGDADQRADGRRIVHDVVAEDCG